MSRILERLAAFGTRPVSDSDIVALALASMVTLRGAPAAELALTKIAYLDCYASEITAWARALAASYALTPRLQPGGRRRRPPVEGFRPDWGHKAVTDGLTLALLGTALPIIPRARELGIGTTPYLRIRDFTYTAICNAIEQYEHALRWAAGEIYDSELSARLADYQDLKWDKSRPWGRLEKWTLRKRCSQTRHRTSPTYDAGVLTESYHVGAQDFEHEP